MSLFQKKQHKIIFWTVLAAIHLFFFLVFLSSGNIYMSDSKEYLTQAYNIKNHLTVYCADLTQKINPAFYTRRPPFYALMILSLKSIYNSDYFVLFAQNLLSILNFAFLLRLMKEFDFASVPKKILYALILFFPSHYIYTNMIMTELILQTLVFWAFFSLFFYLRDQKPGYILSYNIFLSLAVLTKPVLVYFWIPNLIFMAYLFYKNKKPAVLLTGLLMPATILILTLYNFSNTGYFQYSSNKQVSYLDYSATFLLIKTEGQEAGWNKWHEVHSYVDTISDYSRLTEESERIATEIIMKYKYEYLKYHLTGMVNYFMDPGRYDINYFLNIKETNHTGLLYTFAKSGYKGVFEFMMDKPPFILIYLFVMLIINFFMLVSLILFAFSKRIKPELKFFVLFTAFYMSFVSGILGTMRYKIHIYPLILFTIPFTIEYIIRKRSERKIKAITGGQS
ncbi:MAG: glycosyltransferase family 39 protein [Ignavibacteria bacterium]|jgi:hypothetical protein|nr:glycosyltransferase family 39 protein [Ignavibacteria bacterium]